MPPSGRCTSVIPTQLVSCHFPAGRHAHASDLNLIENADVAPPPRSLKKRRRAMRYSLRMWTLLSTNSFTSLASRKVYDALRHLQQPHQIQRAPFAIVVREVSGTPYCIATLATLPVQKLSCSVISLGSRMPSHPSMPTESGLVYRGGNREQPGVTPLRSLVFQFWQHSHSAA